MRHLIDLTGLRYGSLVAVERDMTPGLKKTTFICRCDCGNTKSISSNALTRSVKPTTTCGCKSRLPYGEAALNRLYQSYGYTAQLKGRIFELTLAEFKTLTGSACSYCGKPPEAPQRRPDTIHPLRQHGEYKYNGIDRVDNAIGYVLGNCRSCCSECNFAKRTRDADQYLAHCKKVVDKQKTSILALVQKYRRTK